MSKKKSKSSHKKTISRKRSTPKITFFDKLNYKKISFLLAILIIVIIIIAGFQSEFFQSLMQSNEKFNKVEITELTTASIINGLNNYTEKYIFYPNETVYVYQEFTNISHEDKADFSLSILVQNSGDGKDYYNENDEHITNSKEKGCFWSFETDESWPIGTYMVLSRVDDHMSNYNSTRFTAFFIEDYSIDLDDLDSI